MFNKPNYIDEKYVEATNNGWIDNRTGEILVAIPYMLNRIKAKEAEMNLVAGIEEPVVEVVEVVEELVEEPVVESETKVEISNIIPDLIAVINAVKEAKIESKVTVEATVDVVEVQEIVTEEAKVEDPTPVVPAKKRGRGRPPKN